MTGQFRDAAARFSAEVEAAMTRARRAAAEARARSAQFRKENGELAEQAKSGQLRDVRRDEVEPTSDEPHKAATEFRTAHGLPVEPLPDAAELLANLPTDPEPVAVEDDDEDFSQHQIMVDADHVPAEQRPVEPDTTQSSDVGEPSSQQRIPLLDNTDAFRDEDVPAILDQLAPPQNPS